MLFNLTPCWLCSLFTFSIAFFLESIKARDFLKMTPIPACLLGQSVDGCVTLWALFDNKLAFFLSFKTAPDYFKCIPPGTKRIWFSSHCTWVFLSKVAKETERAAHPILVIPASGWGGSLPAGQEGFYMWLPEQNHLHSLLRSCLTGWRVLGFPIHHNNCAFNCPEELQYLNFYSLEKVVIQDVRIIS